MMLCSQRQAIFLDLARLS